MSDNLILYNGPTSPFGRKCKIVALILEISHEEKKINIYKTNFLDEYNPLRQVPTLIAANKVIIDSDNICLYLNSLSDKKSLFPAKRYWDCMTMISVANGIMDNAVQRFIEMSAMSAEEQRVKAIERFEKKILRSIDWIEKKYDEFVVEEITMDQIAVACALDYTSFRFSSDWKSKNPKLKNWLEQITKKDYMKITLPGESFKYE